MAQPHKIPMLGALQQMGSNGSGLSLRQNNRGASYFRLESSPRQGAPQVPDTTQAPVAPAVTLSFDLSTELYNRLDDMKRWAWIPDEAEGYVVAEIVSTSGSTVSVITLSGESRSLDRATSEVIEFKRDTIRHIVDDLVRLEDMNIPTIMMNLKERAKRDLIYTNVGSILVSVNPYQMLPIYTPAVMEQYRRQIPNLPPHPFSVADQCYRALFEEKKNQAILVSGESGAGKTEAVKVVLQYLAEAAGSSSGVEQKILLANPILEAFGNAKTIRNNNSSRFGKWVEIHFSSGRIIGAKTTNYLLEKTRVVQQAATERNYHIFYQLVAYANAEGAANAELKTSLGLGTASEYAFMSSGGCYTIPGVDDVDEFKQTMKAMKQLQFDEVQIGVVFKIIAAILHLGNVNFDRESDEKAKVSPSTQPSLVKAAQLLAVNAKELEKALTTRSILIMNETTEIPLNDLKARESRDSLAKFLYGELFDWLVQMINGALAGTAKGPVQFIGVLDIFGFEIFQHNSFEQLCINFTNEKMQQMFNSSIFKEEEAIYRAEGINHESVTFVDNQVVLDLIEKKPTGLLPMLDEEIRMPKATDKTFLDKISGQHKEAANFSRPVKIANSFTVQHYAGHVTYNVEGFLDKNRDTMFDDLIRVIQSTKIPTIKTIVTAKEGPQAAASGPSKKAATRSLASQFVAQLKDLNDTIAATSSHYIRCIKPNTEFKPCSSLFDTPMSLRQLRYAGVFEAVAIRKNGFPYRLTYEDFVKRFYMISKSPLGTIHGIPREEAKSKVELIAEAMGDFRARLQFGQSLVFYKADELKRLEEYRSSAMKGKVVLVQTLWRGARARRQFAKLAAIRSGLISAMEKRTVEALEEALGASLEVDWELREAAQARVMLTRVKLEAKLIARIAIVFSNPESLGELNQQQEEKAQEFVDEAAEMNPPFEHEKVSSLVAMMKKSEKLREERLEAEAAAERERLARRTEEERLAAELAAAKEAERLATEQNKKKLAEQFHLSAWEGEESENEKTKNALEVLFVEKVPTPRQRSASIVEFDPEAMALAEPQTRQRSATLEARDAAALAAALEAEKADEMAKDAARMAQLSMDELNKIERVKNRLLEATSAAPYSIFDGVMFMPDGTVMVSMQANQALKSAIIAAQQIGAFDSPDKELRKAIYTAQMLMGIRMDAANENWEGIRNRIEGAQGSTSGFIEVPEISAARLLSSKNDIADKLEAAAAARDEPMLRQLLIEAKSTSYDASAYEAVHQALVDLLAFVEASLAANDYVKIQSAIQALEQLGIPKYLVPYHDRCQSAIAARKPVLENMIRKALNEMPDRVELASLQTQASVLNIKSTDTERLAEIVSLSGEKLCRLQLEAAKTMANEERIWQLNLELKGHLLERFAKKLTYQDAPSLKTPAEFASGKVFGKDKVMDGLLAWTSTPIHAALTRDLDKKSEEQATKLFRNVMGWMGDRHYSYTVTLIQEIINKVVSVAALRDEIYAQVIKQLTNNPSADSMKRGWQLLLVLLMSVPPSPKFENYVGAWLLINGQSYHIHELHETIFKGALPQPPTLPEIIYILYHLPPTPGESYASAKTVTLEQAQKSGVDLSNPLATPAMDRFDKHATLRGHKDNIKKERKRISDMRPPKRK